MGKDRTNKETQPTQMGQYTAQNSGASLQKDHPLEKGAEPIGAQILAAIVSSRHAMQTQIVAIAVNVNLLRADLNVVAERLVATEKEVTCLQSDMDMLKALVAILEAKTHKLEARVESPEAAWDWLERNDETGTPDFLHGKSSGRPRGTVEVHIAAHRSTRHHCAGRGSRVIVRSDRTLSLERQRQERKEDKLFVQTVTSDASSGRLSPEVRTEDS
ncbi:hypothetical protein NDU88_000982 [Pleurodeles waltl]|uniref:Uncharacterized protein n=1 Tax=Pleurodeles waltl TaxID=8319 RepID=A0AAV7UTH3_PLEWA|nr:hypothetical protein NDU88_000982 [Pleurodeles waltl]